MVNKYKIISFLVGVFLLSETAFAQNADITRLDLATCIEVALENNLTLKRSETNLALSEAALLQSQGQRIPSISAGGSTGYRWGRSINPVTNLFETNRIGNINVSANSNVTLFAGRQITNSINQAKTDIQVNQLNVQTTENNISLNVINLFINVIFSKEQLNIAKTQLRTTKEQLEVTSKRVEAGALPYASKLDLEAQNATNELEVINAENNLRIAKLNLLQAMQLPFVEEMDVVAPDLDPNQIAMTNENVDEIFQISAEVLPQIKAAELSVLSAEYGVRAARGAFLPTLGASANLFSNYIDRTLPGVDRPTFITQIENNLSQAANLQLSIPIFSNFRNKSGLQRAKLQMRLSEINEFETRNQLRQDIESAYTTANAARLSYRASLTRVASLEEAFRIAQQRFDAGAINSVDYQVAQNNLFNAQADLINSKYNYIFRVKVLDFYLGNPLSL
jgi:outer membrane protein